MGFVLLPWWNIQGMFQQFCAGAFLQVIISQVAAHPRIFGAVALVELCGDRLFIVAQPPLVAAAVEGHRRRPNPIP